MAGRAGAKKKNKVGVCIMCRETFQCARSDKRTCSDRCRKRWQVYKEMEKREQRERAKEPQQSERLIAIINQGIKHSWGHR